ncbi:MAG: glycosyltransferase family 4 protein [Tannerellaceae bacterium]|jgi:glycosyltransferase involved in cell wall biosynthesis|nr:glycosyltransferase family 4 protein [Tannerellaceae bacterium]
MKAGFDAKRITHNGTGLGNYGRIILNSFTDQYPGNEYILYSPGPGNLKLRDQLQPSQAISFRYPTGANKLFSSFWRTFGITAQLKKDKVDLFHGLSNELPLNIGKSKIPSVVSIHDLIFLRYPRLYSAIDRRIYAYKFKQACRQSDRIIAVSEQTKRDIISFFSIDEDKIDIVYSRCNLAFYSKVSDEGKATVREKYALLHPYILYVGSIEERKNLLLIVKALKGIKEDITLLAIGRHTPYMDTVESYMKENNLQGRVRFLTNVPFADLPAFYQMAEIFVYPSFFEGFGLPILEALVSDVPVIAATGSCLEEAGGPGSLYTDPNNENELREMIQLVLTNKALAGSMRVKGLAYSKSFANNTLAGELMNVYKCVL